MTSITDFKFEFETPGGSLEPSWNESPFDWLAEAYETLVDVLDDPHNILPAELFVAGMAYEAIQMWCLFDEVVRMFPTYHLDEFPTGPISRLAMEELKIPPTKVKVTGPTGSVFQAEIYVGQLVINGRAHTLFGDPFMQEVADIVALGYGSIEELRGALTNNEHFSTRYPDEQGDRNARLRNLSAHDLATTFSHVSSVKTTLAEFIGESRKS